MSVVNDCSPERRQCIDSALRSVIDPEIGINIVDLGLVYSIEVEGNPPILRLQMTMTTPACPLKNYLAHQIALHLTRAQCGIKAIEIVWVWDPPWTPAMINPDVRVSLGFQP